MSLRTPLGRARGLGSAKEGTHHWWIQRINAVALVLLSIWFVASLLSIVGADYIGAAAWLQNPLNAIIMILFIVAGFHHLHLGLQVVIEDYVHGPMKIVSLMVIKLTSWGFSAASIFSILKVALA